MSRHTFDQTDTLDACSTPEKAADYTKAAAAEYAKLVKAGEKATVILAKAAYAAKAAGLIGKKSSPVTFESWAEDFPYRDREGKVQFYKKARVSQFALAGEAFTRHEIDPESELGRKILAGVSTPVRDAIVKEYTSRANPEKKIGEAVKKAAKKSPSTTRTTNATGDTWPRKKPSTDAEKIAALEFLVAGWKIEKPEKVADTLRDIAGSLLAIAEHGEVKAELAPTG